MSKPISPDDLVVGEVVTMWKGKTNEFVVPDKDSSVGVSLTTKSDGSFTGRLLQITGVDLPFVAFTEFNPFAKQFGGPSHVVDVRQGWTFGRLSSEFCVAVGYEGAMTKGGVA